MRTSNNDKKLLKTLGELLEVAKQIKRPESTAFTYPDDLDTKKYHISPDGVIITNPYEYVKRDAYKYLRR